MERVRDACFARDAHAILSPLEQEKRERAMARGLADHGLSTDRAEDLADVGFTMDLLTSSAARFRARRWTPLSAGSPRMPPRAA